MGYRAYDPHPALLFGYDPVRDLPPDHLARFIDEVVEETLAIPDLPRGRGQPGYDPRLCVKVLVYGYATGVRSSRQLEQNCSENLAYRYLVGEDVPSYRTLCMVRKEKKEWLEAVWVGVFSIAKAAGMAQVGRVVVDATKIRANASAESVVKADEYEAIRQELERILAQAEEVDAREDTEGHQGKTRLDKQPKKEQMRDIVRRVRAELAKQKRAQAEARQAGGGQAKPARLERTAAEAGAAGGEGSQAGKTGAAHRLGQPTLEAEGVELRVMGEEEEEWSAKQGLEGVAQGDGLTSQMRERIEQALEAIKEATGEGRKHVSLTDPDAEMMPEGNGNKIRECHSLEAAIDKGSRLLAAAQTTQQASDNERLEPIVTAAQEQTGVDITEVDADSGFFKSMAMVRLEQRGIHTCVPDSSTACDLHRGRPVGTSQSRNGGWAPMTYDALGDCYWCSQGNELRLGSVGQEHGQRVKVYIAQRDCSGCPVATTCFHNNKGKRRWVRVCEHGEQVREILQRFNQPGHWQRYRHRGQMIETVWGFLRGSLNYNRWLLRGKEGVAAEGTLFKLAYQLRKVHGQWAMACGAA